jgi:hypothetical protein
MNRELVPHFTQTPDVCFDFWMPLLTGAEWKVVSYVIRKTYGWGKVADAIPCSQIRAGQRRKDGTRVDMGTGLGPTQIWEALRVLCEAGLLLKQNRFRPDGGNDGTAYALNLEWDWRAKGERLAGLRVRKPETPLSGNRRPPSPVSGEGVTPDPSPVSGDPPLRKPETPETAFPETSVQETAAARDMVHEGSGRLGCRGSAADVWPDEKAAAGFPPGWEMTGAPASRENAAGKAAAAALDIKSAPDLLPAEPEGTRAASLTAGLIETLCAWEMPEEVAAGLVAVHGPEAVRYWVDRADGKERPAGFVRKMLSTGAARASPSPQRAESREQRADPDAQAQALYERTKAEARARQEGGPTTEEAWGQAMTSLAAMLPGAAADLERRGLLRRGGSP